MSVPDRKYLSEHAVNIYSARWLTITASQLASDGKMDAETQEVSNLCHIYVVCRRPSMSIEPERFSFIDGKAQGELLYKIDGVTHNAPFSFSFNLADGATEVRVSPYPHREIQSLNPEGEIVRYVPSDFIEMTRAADIPIMRNLEVLYVGQAFADGKRSAVDRLKSHSTLQKILANMQYNNPDDEVVILAFEYLPYRIITMMDGRDRKAIHGESDSERFSSILANPLTKHQQICLVEAALIRYFQPTYNEIYKASFPYSEQKILLDCYRLDFAALIVEIDTEELALQLLSTKVAANTHHIAKFDLIDPTERLSFFTFVHPDGTASKMPDVISPSQ